MITKLHYPLSPKRTNEKESPQKFRNSFSKISAASPYSPTKFSTEERTRIVLEGQSGNKTIQEICAREGISLNTFQKWTQEFLKQGDTQIVKENHDDTYKFNIVIEGKNGQTSIAEICRRENISHETFLAWSSTFLKVREQKLHHVKIASPYYIRNKEQITAIANQETFDYLENYIDFAHQDLLVISSESSRKLYAKPQFRAVVNLQKINDIRYINKYFEKVNAKLAQGGLFAGCLETFSARKQRKAIHKIPVISNLFFAFEFLVKRVLPKLSVSKKYYFDFTKGNDRLLSKAEGLGRLVCCGFRIMDYKTIDGLLYFVVKKEKEPNFDMNPSYGPLYKMPRLGKDGKIIGVYKFRTMHPYSEYLQDYVLRAHGYAATGKPAEDFRIPAWGKFMRRFWLDELPQLLNVVKGDLKLVGIRPVSERYFQDIPKEMQKLRLTQKPGCIPPYVSLDRDGNVMSVLQSEKEYLQEKIKNPYTTDIRYFFKAIYNIVFRHKRSA